MVMSRTAELFAIRGGEIMSESLRNAAVGMVMTLLVVGGGLAIAFSS